MESRRFRARGSQNPRWSGRRSSPSPPVASLTDHPAKRGFSSVPVENRPRGASVFRRNGISICSSGRRPGRSAMPPVPALETARRRRPPHNLFTHVSRMNTCPRSRTAAARTRNPHGGGPGGPSRSVHRNGPVVGLLTQRDFRHDPPRLRRRRPAAHRRPRPRPAGRRQQRRPDLRDRRPHRHGHGRPV